jgi:hypothetical protein
VADGHELEASVVLQVLHLRAEGVEVRDEGARAFLLRAGSRARIAPRRVSS